MRRSPVPILVLLAAACGSSSPTGTTPPPTGGTPAADVVQAGDGQQGEPGAALPTRPSVLVKDASGNPVAGASVVFAVDSGGGSISSTPVTTGNDGVATGGTWTLGPAEGRNILKVTVGTLPALKIAAVAAIGSGGFPSTTIGTGGGSINVIQPGPLNGFSLAVPGGAFSSSLTATVTYASNTSMPRAGGIVPVSPLITIGTAMTDYAATPLTIHIPATIPAGDFPVIVAYDAATGSREVLTTIAWDANGVTGVTNTLSAARIFAGGFLRANGRASLDAPGAVVVAEAVPPAVLGADYDSGYRPGVDDWEFPPTVAEVDVAHNDALQVTIGMPATSLWYFNAHPGSGKLNGRFLERPDLPLSDRRGIRWATSLGYKFDVTATNSVLFALAPRARDAAGFDQNQLNTIRTRFAIGAQDGGRPKPQLMAFLINDLTLPGYLIAYRVTGTQVYVADPFTPGDQTRVLSFPPGSAMQPYVTGPSLTLSQPLATGLSTLIPLDQISASYAQVLDGTVGNADFPTAELHGWAGRLYDTLYVVDTLRWWVECAGCTNGYTTTLNPAPAAHVTTGALYVLNPTGSVLAGGLSTGGFLSSTQPAAGQDISLGLVLQSAGTPGQTYVPGGTSGAWLDWHPFVLRRLQTAIAPDPLNGYSGTPFAMTFKVTQTLLPPHVNYIWDFGDQQPAVPVTVADNPAVQHTYAAVGNYPVTAKLVDTRNNQVIGQVSATATITLPQYAWQFTSVALTGTQLPPGGIGSEASDTTILNFFTGWINDLQASPMNSLFFLGNNGTCQDIFLEQFAAGQFRPIIDSTGTIGKILGIFGLTAGCDPDHDYVESLTVGTIGSGAIVGSAVDIPKAESIVLPGGSINGTTTGTHLQGTFTWRVRFSTGEAVYSFNFQGTQVLPAP